MYVSQTTAFHQILGRQVTCWSLKLFKRNKSKERDDIEVVLEELVAGVNSIINVCLSDYCFPSNVSKKVTGWSLKLYKRNKRQESCSGRVAGGWSRLSDHRCSRLVIGKRQREKNTAAEVTLFPFTPLHASKPLVTSAWQFEQDIDYSRHCGTFN